MSNLMNSEDVKSRLISALNMLVEKDKHLLNVDANERSITHRLAVYLEGLFPEWDVDCEYNRNFDAVKRAGIKVRNARSDSLVAPSVFPDIIIHKRKSFDNLLVIEAKKATTETSHKCVQQCYCDRFKLFQLKNQLNYENSAYLVFPIYEILDIEVQCAANSILKEFNDEVYSS